MVRGIGGNFDEFLLKGVNGINSQNGNNVTETESSTELSELLSGANSEDAAIGDIENDYAEALEAIGGTVIGSVASNEEIEKMKEEVEELEKEKQENEENMEAIREEIETLSAEAAKNITEAAAAQQNAVAENKEESQAIVDEQMKTYIAANEEGGEGMTREQLQQNIKGAVPNLEMGEALAAATEASEQLAEVDCLIGDLNSLIKDNQGIEQEIADKTSAIEEAEKAAAEAPEGGSSSDGDNCNPQPCEPQGFQDNEGNQYDFFIDKDGNNDLSNETEFLGYEGGLQGQEQAWQEMTDLDTNLDGLVDASELTAGGVMVYKTDANGNQQAMSIEEAFGEDSDLAISTTQHDEAKQGVGPKNFTQGTGSENNELWGTYDVSLNGETLNGYQTNDDINWLKENYAFTDYANGAIESNTGLEEEGTEEFDNSKLPEDITDWVAYSEFANERNMQQKEELNAVFKEMTIDEDTMKGFMSAITEEAKAEAKDFIESLKKEENEEGTDAEISEETIAENGSLIQPRDEQTSSTTDMESLEELFLEEELTVAA